MSNLYFYWIAEVEGLSFLISISTVFKVFSWLLKFSRPLKGVILIISITRFLFLSDPFIFLLGLKWIGLLFCCLLFVVLYHLFWYAEMTAIFLNVFQAWTKFLVWVLLNLYHFLNLLSFQNCKFHRTDQYFPLFHWQNWLLLLSIAIKFWLFRLKLSFSKSSLKSHFRLLLKILLGTLSFVVILLR